MKEGLSSPDEVCLLAPLVSTHNGINFDSLRHSLKEKYSKHLLYEKEQCVSHELDNNCVTVMNWLHFLQDLFLSSINQLDIEKILRK